MELTNAEIDLPDLQVWREFEQTHRALVKAIKGNLDDLLYAYECWEGLTAGQCRMIAKVLEDLRYSQKVIIAITARAFGIVVDRQDGADDAAE